MGKFAIVAYVQRNDARRCFLSLVETIADLFSKRFDRCLQFAQTLAA